MLWHTDRRPDEDQLTLHPINPARTGFEPEALNARLARIPTRADLVRTALLTIAGTARIVILWL
jgi:hypothetical protein